MVAIFTGAGVGLERSSITKLGSQGILGDPVQGRSGDSVFVNAATGNLIVEKQDEFLVGLGPDVNIARTYNSLGDASDENGDNWRQSTDRRVTLTAGTAGAVGSKVVRVSGDGSRIEYTWDVVRLAYVTKEGAGAERAIQKYDEQYEVAGGSEVRLQVNETGSVTVQQFKSSTETVNPAQKIWSKDYFSALDKIVQSGSNWIWTDGNTLAVEQYNASGQLTKVTDRNGQYQTYIYDAIDANHLTQVTDDNGDWVKYNWNGNNIISVQTGYTDPGTTALVTLTRVRYGYDTSNRLSTVTTDLTPGDESVTDNAKYVVTYTYDSTSRVKTISQSDGSLITVYYESAAPTARVTSLVQQVSPGDTRTTSFSYSLGSTAVTDSAGQVTTLTCDGNQNLTGVSMPPAEAGDLPQTVSFTYNADGTLSKITDPLGKVLTFNSYTADGQPQSITDKLGNVTTRTYGSKHELLSETTTASDNATLIGVSVSHTTRYVYDTLGNLRFEIGALGDVREYRYSTVGLLMTVVGYPERRFTVALDGVGNPIQPSEADITAWIASIKKPDGTTSDLSWTEIAKYTYDSRGEITTVMDYGIATDGGAPSTAQGYTKYTYAYDQVGRLVTKQMGVQTPTSYLYDGMGRLIATIDGTGTTNVVYNDATTTTVLTMQSGLVRTSVYNLAGDLVSETDNATSSVPNSAGALSSWSTVNLTSAATTAIDGKAAYLYTVQTTGTSGYAYSGLQAVTAGQTVTLQLTLKETASGGIERIGLYGDASGWGADDLASATILSGPGRLSQAAGGLFTVQGLSITEGTVIQVTRVVTADENIRVRAYIGSSNATTTAGDAAILAGPRLEIANEPAYLYDKLGRLRVSIDAYGNASYALYDKAGRRTADLGADGSLVEYRYDLGDRLIAKIRYANKVAGGMLASATNTNTLSNPTNTLTIADLIPTSSTDDEWAWNIYDAMDRRIESIAGDGAVTRFDYDKQGNLTRTVGYLTRLDVSAFKTTPPTTTTWPTGSWAGARNFYSKQGQLIGNTDAYGALTERVYDYAGRLIDVVAYEKLPTIAAPNTASFDEIKANILTLGGTNRHTRYVYDGQILRYVIDPLNYVTQYNYDGAAQTKFTIQYYTPLASTTTDFTFDAVTAATTANSTYDRKTWLVMNSAGQLAWTIDGEGSVTGYAYDVTGAKVRETHYATARMTTSLPTSSDMDTWATGAASASSDRTTRMFYDTRGQLVFVADAEGYITRTVYDEERRVSDTYRFDTPRTGLNDASTFASMLSWVSSQTGYVRERTEYDALGRVANTYDALNVRTHYEYYATGKVLSRTQAIDTADAATTSYTYDAAGRVETMTDAEGVITTYAYDVFGNVTSQTRGLVQTGTDANGNSIYNITDAATSAYAYDLDGRLTTQTDGYGSSTPSVAKYTYTAFGQISTKTSAYGTSDAAITRYTYDGAGRVDTRIDGDTSSVATTTRYTYTAFGQILTETTADGTADASTTRYTYDRNGQVKTRTDSYGASEASVTRYTYDALGNVASTTRADGTSDAATTSYTYFRNGWLKDVTDALGNAGVAAASTESRTESYQYDARGNRTQMTNRLGGITTFFYDKLDRVTREYSRAPDASSNVAGTYVVKASTYNSRGNRTRLVEGTSTAAAATSAVIALRTTNYQFDKLDRVVKVTRDTATALADDMVTTSTVTPTEDYTYDARGNLIRFDRYGLVNGTGLKADIATTFTYYDQLDRKTTDIQATTATSGIRSDYGYDVRGNMTSTKVYVAQVTLPTTAGGTAPAPSGSYRQTTFAYDRLDRLTDSSVISTSAGAIVSGSWNGTVYATASGASLVTHYDYDDRGNVIKTTDPNGNEIWSWYDDLDRKTAQLDAGGYLTRWTYDARGNVKNEQRYATRWTGAASTIAPPTVAASSADRVTDYTYDQNGNRLSEKRSNLAAWAVNSSNGVLNTGLTYSLTRYSYNALGQVLVKEFGAALSAPYADDGTAAFTYTYDSLGRLQTEAHAKYTDASGNVVVPTTGYKYDALGNLTANTQLGATGTYTADARVTAYSYGQGGRLLSVTDAEGFVHTYSYDALGRQKKDAYNRVVNSDAGVTSSATSTVAEATGTTYDRAGRVLSQSVWTTVGTTLTRIGVTSYVYNTAGQVRQQGQGADTSGNVLYQVTNSYDSAGRLVATNAGDGI